METRLDKITKTMSKARQQKRQVWILDTLIAIFDNEALKGFREQADLDYGYHSQFDQ
jgi:hypothetical protein